MPPSEALTGPASPGQHNGTLPDHQLLEAFVGRQDGAAFGALLHRHGPMVLNVCRRVLKHVQDAEVARQVEDSSDGKADACILRARCNLARREFATARLLLEKAQVIAPQALGPRVLLSHALLQEGKDWAAAEKTLRDILTVAPDHAEARQNLGVLLRRKPS